MAEYEYGSRDHMEEARDLNRDVEKTVEHTPVKVETMLNSVRSFDKHIEVAPYVNRTKSAVDFEIKRGDRVLGRVIDGEYYKADECKESSDISLSDRIKTEMDRIQYEDNAQQLIDDNISGWSKADQERFQRETERLDDYLARIDKAEGNIAKIEDELDHMWKDKGWTHDDHDNQEREDDIEEIKSEMHEYSY